MTEKWRLCSDIIGNLTIKGENQSIGRFIKLEEKQCQYLVDLLNKQEERIKSKERVIKAYEDYIKTLKEDGVLDD